MYALSRHVTVVGCSSMGAPRAAELWPYGMAGCGRIFAAYRDGIYESDEKSGYRTAELQGQPIQRAQAFGHRPQARRCG
ncbi:hypothetical protein FE633_02410 [Streptomyces montanus]|uniref:TfuA-like core domain-containing protein n=2 Tax=Streptomyces montanus TaxID=2580423 RepID=A0A5R9G2X3_9ACTN|nr:hypothetical protein FE633_02410 [Streptomyces montanus]